MKTRLVLFVCLTIGCSSSHEAAAPNAMPDSGVAPTSDASPLANTPRLDGSSGPACPAVPGCGGNILGSWQVVRACLPNAQQLLAGDLGPQFADCYVDMSYGYSGQLDYNLDGTFVWKEGQSFTSVYMDVEERCFVAMNKKTCAESAPRCQAVNGICRCAMSQPGDAGTESETSSGTFVVNNSLIMQKTVTGDDVPKFSSNVLYKNNPQAAGEFGTYCVSGDTLTVTFDEAQLTAVRIAPATATIGFPAVSPIPVPAPTVVAEVYKPLDKNCPEAEPVGNWRASSIAIDERLQQNLIKRIRKLDPDGECAAEIGIRDEGFISFGQKTSLFAGSASVKEKLSIDIRYGAACLAAKGADCKSVEAGYLKLASVLDPLETVACSVAVNGDCICSRSQGGEEPDCGYSAITGNDYQLMPNRFSGSPFEVTYAHTQLADYCQIGNQMTVYDQAIIIGGLRGEASVTLQKQD